MASEPGTVSSRTPNYNCLYDIRMFCPLRVFSLMPRYFLSPPVKYHVINPHSSCPADGLLEMSTQTEKREKPQRLRWCQATWRPRTCEGVGCATYQVHTAIDTDDSKNIRAQLNCKYVCCLLNIEINMRISMASMYKCI